MSKDKETVAEKKREDFEMSSSCCVHAVAGGRGEFPT